MISSKLIAAGMLTFLLGGVGVVAAASANNPVASTDNPQTTENRQRFQPSSSINDDKLDLDDDLESPLTPTITSTLTITSANKPAIAISSYFSVPISSVLQLHISGWGFGEIFKLYNYALLTGQTVESIQAMRDVDQMGWGQIAKALGLHPGNKGNNLGGIISGRNIVTPTVGTKKPVSIKIQVKKPVKANHGHGRKP